MGLWVLPNAMAATTDAFFRILYTGRASPACEADVDGVLADILATGVARNRKSGLTSILLFHRGWFIGALEGPEPALQATFERMKNDPRHLGLHTIAQAVHTERLFPAWSFCAWALSGDDAAVLAGFDEEDDFDGSAVPERTVLRLLAVVASAHGRRFAAQQRLRIRREPLGG
jgi:hypothetical protein